MGFLWMQACVVLLLCLTAEVHPASASENCKSYYETLHVDPAATDSQIKKAFRSLAVKYHLDKNKSTHAETTFREIAEAYAVLSDKQKRRLYDLVGHEAYLETEASFDPEDDEPQTSFHFSFSDFFHGFDENFVVDESHQWRFQQESAQHQSYGFEAPNGNFFWEDIFEDEDAYYY